MATQLAIALFLAVPLWGGSTIREAPDGGRTIQAAIDAATPGDRVLLAPGEYLIDEPLTYRGKAITLLSSAGAEETVIRMSDAPAYPGRGSVVIFENAEPEEALLQGVTLTGGKGSTLPDSDTYHGGAIFCNGSSPTIKDCILRDNIVEGDVARGGGVYLTGSGSLLLRCTIAGNMAGGWESVGGGIAAGGSLPRIHRCTITDNAAEGRGGGILPPHPRGLSAAPRPHPAEIEFPISHGTGALSPEDRAVASHEETISRTEKGDCFLWCA